MSSKEMSQLPGQNSEEGYRERSSMQKRLCVLGGDNLSLQPCSRHHDSGNTFSYNLEGISPSCFTKATAADTTFTLACTPSECGKRKGDHLGHRCTLKVKKNSFL